MTVAIISTILYSTIIIFMNNDIYTIYKFNDRVSSDYLPCKKPYLALRTRMHLQNLSIDTYAGYKISLSRY